MIAAGYDVMAFLGQSNQQSGAPMLITTDAPSMSVWQMRNDDTPGIAIDPLDYPSKSENISAGITGTVRIGSALRFMRDYYGPNRLTTGRRSLIVPCARNGVGLVAGPLAVNGFDYLETIRRCNLAMAIPGSQFVGFSWRHMETDALNSVAASAYQSALDAMFAGLRAAITGASDGKIIITGPSSQWVTDTSATGGSFGTRTAVAIRAVLIDTPNRLNHCRYSDPTLPTLITTPDPTFLHWDAPAQRLLAERDWLQYDNIVNNEVDPYASTFVPGVPWDRVVEAFNVPRGSGVPFEFTAVPTQPVDGDNYAATVTLYDGTIVEYSVADGNMTVNESTGVVTVNPTSPETALWEGVVFMNLWQKFVNDDDRTLLKQIRLNMYYAGWTAI